MIDVNMAQREWRAWGAAWLDTEGHISLFKRNDTPNNFRLVVGIAQKDPAPLLLLCRAIGGGNVAPKKCGVFSLTLTNQTAGRFLRLVEPWVVVKRPAVNAALTFVELLTSRRRDRWNQWTVAEKAKALALVDDVRAFNQRWKDPYYIHAKTTND